MIAGGRGFEPLIGCSKLFGLKSTLGRVRPRQTASDRVLALFAARWLKAAYVFSPNLGTGLSTQEELRNLVRANSSLEK